MKIFFLDTSSFFINLALVSGEQIIYHQEANNQQLSEKIMPLIMDFFQKNQVQPSEIDKIYVTNGPGSFTGIRLGLTITKTMAWDLQIPIYPISTLLLYASHYDEDVAIIIPEKEAMGYLGIYNKNLVKKSESYTDITNKPKIKTIVLNKAENQPINFPKIIKKFKNKELNVHNIKPNYLKQIEVEKTGD